MRGLGWVQALAQAEPSRHAAWQRVSDDLPLLCPQPEQVFHAFDTDFDRVRVVILGQDPYPTAGHATGLAFAVPPTVVTPPTLRNILRELHADAVASGWIAAAPATLRHLVEESHDDAGGRGLIFAESPILRSGRSGRQVDAGGRGGMADGTRAAENVPLVHSDLEQWAKQGVLLLNSVLTCRAGESLAHERVGWQEFTAAVLDALCARPTPPVAVLWGRHAQALGRGHPWLGTVESSHPSPLSARRGFFGSRPFSRVNEILAAHGLSPIQWVE